MSAYTLFLNNEWDITLNEDGKIKTAVQGYAVAQNASNAVRLFKNDAYFDASKGIPHFNIELGHSVAAVPVLESHMVQAMRNVEGVADAVAFLEVDSDRVAGGNAYITLQSGDTAEISLM